MLDLGSGSLILWQHYCWAQPSLRLIVLREGNEHFYMHLKACQFQDYSFVRVIVLFIRMSSAWVQWVWMQITFGGPLRLVEPATPTLRPPAVYRAIFLMRMSISPRHLSGIQSSLLWWWSLSSKGDVSPSKHDCLTHPILQRNPWLSTFQTGKSSQKHIMASRDLRKVFNTYESSAIQHGINAVQSKTDSMPCHYCVRLQTSERILTASFRYWIALPWVSNLYVLAELPKAAHARLNCFARQMKGVSSTNSAIFLVHLSAHSVCMAVLEALWALVCWDLCPLTSWRCAWRACTPQVFPELPHGIQIAHSPRVGFHTTGV